MPFFPEPLVSKFVSIAKGAYIAAAGAALAYLEHEFSGLDVGPVLTPVLTALNSVIVNAVRKLLAS